MSARLRWSVRSASVAMLALAVAAGPTITAAAVAAPVSRGAIDSIDVHGAVVTVQGWAWDGGTAPTTVTFTDTAAPGAALGSTTVVIQRRDVMLAVPGAPLRSGYQADLTVPDGRHHICAWTGGGTAPIGCGDVTSKLPVTHEAMGSIDSIVRDRDGIRLRGWVWDPDTTGGSDSVTVTDETGATPIMLGSTGNGVTRRDVSRTHPGAYATTGIDDVFWAGVPGGDRRICVRTGFVDELPGTPLGCRTVKNVGDPVGSFDALGTYGLGNLTLKGWAFDWSASSTVVHLYDNGRFWLAVPTYGNRADVSKVYPGSPEFNAWFVRRDGVPRGKHTICAYAINTPAGNNVTLGCRDVTVG